MFSQPQIAVSLKIKGMAHTEWTEENSSSTSERKSETTYYAHIDYIKSKQYLFEPPHKGKSFDFHYSTGFS